MLLQQLLHNFALRWCSWLGTYFWRREIASDEQLAASHVARHVTTYVARYHYGATMHSSAECSLYVACYEVLTVEHSRRCAATH